MTSMPARAPQPPSHLPDDAQLIAALRQGDEQAFLALVGEYHASLVRLAQAYVSDAAVAEEVAQETWLGVLRGVARFEGRSSLKTWIYSILANQARTRALRERRSLPFSALGDPEAEPYEPAVSAARFRPAEDTWAGHWAARPQSWDSVPEERLLARETLAHVRRAIQDLPPTQRAVITLRDIDGCTAAEACHVLGVSETHQRVLLHRARAKVRQALEHYLDKDRAYG